MKSMNSNYIICLIVLFVSCSVHGQNPYFIPDNSSIPLSATGINSMDVSSFDVDNDQDLDLIIAGEFQRNLLLFNDGDGVFTEDPSRLFPEKNTGDPFPGEDSEDIAFADFNMDGNMDVIFVSEDSTFHELLINDGNGNFTFIAYNFPSSKGNAVAVLDLNSDSFPDIVIGNTGQNHVYINNQNLTFTQENNRWPSNTEGTQDLKLVDLDGDGDMDVVEGIDIGSNNILINNNGFFSEENNRLPTTGLTLETRKISLGDVDGQNGLDIFVSTVEFAGGGIGDLQNRLYLNDGNGFFTDATVSNLPVYTQQTLDAIFLDYDRDGDLDLITTDFQNPTSNYHSFENDGNGIFTESTGDVFDPFGYTSGICVYAADFNDDTYPDLYFGNFQETDDILFFSENALEISNVLEKAPLVLYPNPSTEKLFLSNPQKLNLKELNIFDTSGKIIAVFNISGLTERETLDISKLNSGIYKFVIESEIGFIVRTLVID